MACEEERTRLIGQIANLLREGSVPEDAHKAGLTLIGWLARRMPGEPVSLAGVEEMLRRCKEGGHGSASNGSAARTKSRAVTNGSADKPRASTSRSSTRRSR
jgi:uncharacterized protein YidB (DUF937 family)